VSENNIISVNVKVNVGSTSFFDIPLTFFESLFEMLIHKDTFFRDYVFPKYPVLVQNKLEMLTAFL